MAHILLKTFVYLVFALMFYPIYVLFLVLSQMVGLALDIEGLTFTLATIFTLYWYLMSVNTFLDEHLKPQSK